MKLRCFLALALGVVVSSCDSGDIYPKEPNYEDTQTLNIKYTLSGVETIPDLSKEEYKLRFGFIVFCADGKTIAKYIDNSDANVDNTEQTISIAYVPYNAARVELVIVGTKISDNIYTFKSVDVPTIKDGESSQEIQFNDASLPIELASFGRVKAQVFMESCNRCHSGNQKPDLINGNVYNDILSIRSPHPISDMNIITPFNSENSSMYHILTNDVQDIYPHNTSVPFKVNDIVLLKSWIEGGAPNN